MANGLFGCLAVAKQARPLFRGHYEYELGSLGLCLTASVSSCGAPPAAATAATAPAPASESPQVTVPSFADPPTHCCRFYFLLPFLLCRMPC